MKPFDIIRALIAALAASLNANPDKQKQLDAANALNDDLSNQLATANGALASDEQRLADLGTPLSEDEVAHVNDLLSTVAAAPAIPVDAPPAAPDPAPPAAATGDDSLASGDNAGATGAES